MVLTQEFFNHLLLLLALMYGFTAFKVVLCKPFEKEGEPFDLKKFLLGIAKQLIVMSGVLVVYYAGCKCGEKLLLVQIGDAKLTLQVAIDITIIAVLTAYAAKYIKNLAAFFGIGDKLNDNNVKELDVQDIIDYNVSSDYCGCSCHCNHNHGRLIGYVYAANSCCDNCESDLTDNDVSSDDEEAKG